MEDNESWYNYYRRKYYDSCAEISSCDNQIYNLKNQRQQTINKINQLKTDIKNTQTALDRVTTIIKDEECSKNKLVAVTNKINQASVNFSDMVQASDIRSKDLSDVYSEETTKTTNELNNVFNTLKQRKNNLSTKLSNLQSELNRSNSNLQSIDGDIKRANSNKSYWSQQKNSSYYNMEYYRVKMMLDAC